MRKICPQLGRRIYSVGQILSHFSARFWYRGQSRHFDRTVLVLASQSSF